MRRTTLVLLCLGCTSAKGIEITAEDRRLHLDAVVIDAHCDIAQAMFHEGYDLLARHRTLAWSASSPIGGSTAEDAKTGLTPFGKRVLAEMERLGIVADLSHGSDALFWDVIAAATRPILLTHSAARALSNHPRNASDEMLQAVARNGGAVCVDFSRTFLDDRFRRATQALLQKTKGMLDSEKMELYRRENLPEVRLDTLVDHIEHVARVAGNDHVGRGTDFDDAPMMPVGLEDASKYPAI